MKMGKRVLQRSDGRTALKAKVENVVLKKLSGKKKPKHCLERGVFKSKTEIFMCAKVMSKKKRFLFFFFGHFLLSPRIHKNKKWNVKVTKRVIQTGLTWSEKKAPLLEDLSPGYHPTEDFGKADVSVCNAFLSGEQLGKSLRALHAQWGSQGKKKKQRLVIGTIHDPWEIEKNMQQGAAGNL